MKGNLLKGVFALLMCLCTLSGVEAQTNSVKGKVVAVTGDAMPGVNVLVKGTFTGTTTAADGTYQLNSVPEGSVLVFSLIGYLTQEKAVGNQTVIDLALLEDTQLLNEVVITALGIRREEKTLGYAATTVRENAVKDAKSNNWVNTLSGKVAGLNVQGAGAGPMGSSRITLRGESSLNLDNNQALIVVDGVPVSNRVTGTGHNSHLSADSPVDYGSSVSDINPDDIESVTVLKGPGATALYGSRAAGGALIITTKSGARKDGGIGITVNSNISIEQVNRWPDYQFEYGEGRTDTYYSYLDSPDGPNTSTNVAAGRGWGPKFNGQSYLGFPTRITFPVFSRPVSPIPTA